jgi:hypothetical protein
MAFSRMYLKYELQAAGAIGKKGCVFDKKEVLTVKL